MHYLTVFWKFHQRHLHICGTTCLCRAQSASTWENGFFGWPQPVMPDRRRPRGGAAAYWVRQATGSCLGNAAVHVARDTVKDQSCARNDYELASNKRQQLWSPWITHICMFPIVPVVWAQHRSSMYLGTLPKMCI